MLSRPPSELSTAEEQQRALLCMAYPAVATAYSFAQRFLALISERQSAGLDPWIDDAKGSEVAEMRNVAMGIERDHTAVVGAMSQIWSHGQTEG